METGLAQAHILRCHVLLSCAVESPSIQLLLWYIMVIHRCLAAMRNIPMIPLAVSLLPLEQDIKPF